VGKILSRFSNPSRSTRLSEAEGLSFLRNGGVTYVTGNGVVERGPGDSSWVCESDLLLQGFEELNPPEWGRDGGGKFMILGTCNL
jgi:hypothetical protein